jgi:hypothetical protein
MIAGSRGLPVSSTLPLAFSLPLPLPLVAVDAPIVNPLALLALFSPVVVEPYGAGVFGSFLIPGTEVLSSLYILGTEPGKVGVSCHLLDLALHFAIPPETAEEVGTKIVNGDGLVVLGPWVPIGGIGIDVFALGCS